MPLRLMKKKMKQTDKRIEHSKDKGRKSIVRTTCLIDRSTSPSKSHPIFESLLRSRQEQLRSDQKLQGEGTGAKASAFQSKSSISSSLRPSSQTEFAAKIGPMSMSSEEKSRLTTKVQIANRKRPWGPTHLSPATKRVRTDARIDRFLAEYNSRSSSSIGKLQKLSLFGIRCHSDMYDFEWPTQKDMKSEQLQSPLRLTEIRLRGAASLEAL